MIVFRSKIYIIYFLLIVKVVVYLNWCFVLCVIIWLKIRFGGYKIIKNINFIIIIENS